MGTLSLGEFADKINEIMPAMLKGFMRQTSSKFYKVKVTMPQFVILNLLARMGEAKMSDLARSLNVTTAAMTGIVDRLVRDLYVVRASDPKDRRIIRVKLTAKGSRIVKDIIEERREMIIKMFGKLSQSDREEYLRILKKIQDHLK